MKTRTLMAALALPLVFACMPKPQTVILALQAAVDAENVGRNVRVRVVAVDGRPSPVLGFQQGDAGATLSTGGNPAETLADQVAAGLRKKGFDAVTGKGSGAARTLTVSLEKLEYVSKSLGAVSGEVHLKAAVKALAMSGDADDDARPALERTYSAEQDRDVGLTPTLNAKTRYVNEILNDVLSRVLNDERLLTYLAN